MKDNNDASQKILKAFLELHRVGMKAEFVFYNQDRWFFMDEELSNPGTTEQWSQVETTILEEALDSIEDFPAAFSFQQLQQSLK